MSSKSRLFVPLFGVLRRLSRLCCRRLSSLFRVPFLGVNGRESGLCEHHGGSMGWVG